MEGRRRGGRGGHKVQVEQLILERVNPRLCAYLLHRHDIVRTGVMQLGWRLSCSWGETNEHYGWIVSRVYCCGSGTFSSSDTFACSLLTPTAFLPSVSVLFL